MSTILAIYAAEPKFPASEQQSGAERYQIGTVWVDCLNGPPSQAEVDAMVTPPADTRAGLAVDSIDRLSFEVNFDQENRIRALEGKAPIARVQYRDALVTRWKQLNP